MEYVEREYLFKGRVIPKKFFDAIYTPDWSCRSVVFVSTSPENTGDGIVVKVASGDGPEYLDWLLEEWEDKEIKE